MAEKAVYNYASEVTLRTAAATTVRSFEVRIERELVSLVLDDRSTSGTLVRTRTLEFTLDQFNALVGDNIAALILTKLGQQGQHVPPGGTVDTEQV